VEERPERKRDETGNELPAILNLDTKRREGGGGKIRLVRWDMKDRTVNRDLGKGSNQRKSIEK